MNQQNSKAKKTIEESDLKKCGIVMPISAIDGLSSEHWKEVLTILDDSIKMAEFQPNLVSNGTDVGVIQKRIVQNLYKNPIVVCDVSAKNPNVMFELGLRLAFDKPTIIVKDDKTNYSFDTSPIEHLEYPRDLRFSSIVKFKEDLSKKIIATYKASQENPNYTTFLKHFGEYKISNLEDKEITSDKYILESIESLRKEINFLRRENNKNGTIDIHNYFDRREIKWIVFNAKLQEFVKDNNLSDEFDIKDVGLETELYEFLSSFEEIRKVIPSSRELKAMIEDAIERPEVPF
ncbi:hypothetical protein SAMN02927921_03876 [Sinomicrobium oceani]|uniref:RNA helicase n=1 Tax=Sinomicrobium oceani TaxID=1150368 RepID=A0A1K1RR23_9FLAO|nr:RNA helicase [Sinomicrobium oceani]SFW74236.1 hypothetical protein SAMN02927921_03876 [Sinomicrobium oceani]